jgi:phage I-like protein
LKQVELEARLNKLSDINNSLIGRWTMSKANKELLHIDAKSNQEALQIIRTGEVNNLSAIADYQTRYLKAILHNLVLVGESNMTGAAKLHYENSKMVLHDKLLNKMEEMTVILEDFENRAKSRPEKYKRILIEASDRTLIQWGRDFDTHLDEFAELLKKTFSR